MIESAKRKFRRSVERSSQTASSGARKVAQGFRTVIRDAKRFLSRENLNPTTMIPFEEEYSQESPRPTSAKSSAFDDDTFTPDKTGAWIALSQRGLPPDISRLIVENAESVGRDFSEELQDCSKALLAALSQTCESARKHGSDRIVGPTHISCMKGLIRQADNMIRRQSRDTDKATIRSHLDYMQDALEKEDPKAAWVEMFRLYQKVAFIANGLDYASKISTYADHPALISAMKKHEKDAGGNILRLEIKPRREALL